MPLNSDNPKKDNYYYAFALIVPTIKLIIVTDSIRDIIVHTLQSVYQLLRHKII